MRLDVVSGLGAAGEFAAIDSEDTRKERGAFYTPSAIAEHLADWAIGKNPRARVLDPTCGDGVFLQAAGRSLLSSGASGEDLDEQVVGFDIHGPTLAGAASRLAREGLDARLVEGDFFLQSPPSGTFASPPAYDAVIGNPPFVRYQRHVGEARRLSALAALRQGVRLSGLASSWAALLVHAGAFLAPEGRLAIVLPAELLSVGYAEPVRRWLRRRFSSVSLVMFERLQFSDALENVVLLMSQGSGGCDAFNLFYVRDAAELADIGPHDGSAVALAAEGKWTDLFLSTTERQLFRSLEHDKLARLEDYGTLELGTVTGANSFFALSENTRREFDLREGAEVHAISPPGTRHLRSLAFRRSDWRRLRDAGDRVWLFRPSAGRSSEAVERYKALGVSREVPSAYKCQVRADWWRPPVIAPPDLFFTYMSHRYPKLVTNQARAGYLNSMHGLRLESSSPRASREALALLALNSVTMLGAELYGRSYGGGILKMEPREARLLPMPKPDALSEAWATLRPERRRLDRQLSIGRWTTVVARVDEVLLRDVLRLSEREAELVRGAARRLRARRLDRGRGSARDG